MLRADTRDLTLLAAVVAVATFLLIGDFGVRLANTTGDDSPALFARLLLDPQSFAGDVIATYSAVYGLGTIVHWGPAVLLRLFRIPPEASAVLLVYLQNILVAFSVWVLARAAQEARAVAWLAAVFALAAEVYIWNLANFRSQMAIPYGAHLVLPFLLFAMAAQLKRRKWIAALWLALGVLIHPTMTLLSLVPIGVYSFWSTGNLRTRWRDTMIIVVPSVLVTAVVVWLLARQAVAPMSAPEQLAAMRANVHMNPFNTQHFWVNLLPTMATFVVLLVLGFLRSKVVSVEYRRLVACAFAVAVLYGIAHVGAVKLGMLPLLTLIPLRYTSVLVLLALPLCMSTLVDYLRNGDETHRWAAGSLLILHPLSALGAYWPALAALLTPISWRWPRYLLLALWLFGAFALLLRLPIGNIFTIGARISPALLWAGILLAGLVAVLPRVATTRLLQPIAFFTMLLPLLLFGRNVSKGSETSSSPARALYEAQQWARRHSAPQATFVLEPNISWRVVSQRRALQVWPTDAYVYSRSRAGLEHARAVRTQYQRAPFRHEADVLQFRARFGGDYLVRYAERQPLFRTVYRNEEFAIYELPQRATR